MTLVAWVAGIREVLNTEWDPIGDCPEDEYDTYVGLLLPLLTRPGVSDAILVSFLRRWEIEQIGLPRSSAEDEARRKRTVAALRKLGPGPGSEPGEE